MFLIRETKSIPSTVQEVKKFSLYAEGSATFTCILFTSSKLNATDDEPDISCYSVSAQKKKNYSFLIFFLFALDY